MSGATWTTRTSTVYNFAVEDFRSYFVGGVGAWVHNCDDADIYIPLDEGGGPLQLPRQSQQGGENLFVPDPAAQGAPHTRLGSKISSKTGKVYRTTVEFNGPSFPRVRGDVSPDAPLRQIDWTDHGRAWDHANPHQHPFFYDFDGGKYVRGDGLPFTW